MRVLFFMSHGLLARNFEWFLRELDRRGHDVHVVLDRNEKEGVEETNRLLEIIAAECTGISFGPGPARRRQTLATTGRSLRLMLDALRYLEPEQVGNEKPGERMQRRLPRLVRRVGAPLFVSPSGRRGARSLLRLAELGVPVDEEVRRFVADRRPDVVVVSPLVDPGSPQTDYVRCSRSLGVPSVFAVHSWDNLTMKGGVHELPDLVAVWNDAQAWEAVELHGIPADRVVVTGAVPYDHLFSWVPSPREEFCASVGLDPARPFLLYLGSSRFIAPDESDFVREWLAWVRAASPALAGTQILIRPHPLNPFDGPEPEGAHVLPALASEPGDTASRRAYFDSIQHAAGVVGVLTSGMIEAAIVGRPVHTLLTERYVGSQQRTAHARHLMPESGGILIVGRDVAEHAAQLERSLAGASGRADRQFVDRFVGRPDAAGGASARLVDAVEGGVVLHPGPTATPVRRAAGRILALAGWLVVRAALFRRALRAG